MTVAIFLPAFLITLLGHRTLERIVDQPRVHRLFDGLTAAVVGLIAVTAVTLVVAAIGPRCRTGVHACSARRAAALEFAHGHRDSHHGRGRARSNRHAGRVIAVSALTPDAAVVTGPEFRRARVAHPGAWAARSKDCGSSKAVYEWCFSRNYFAQPPTT